MNKIKYVPLDKAFIEKRNDCGRTWTVQLVQKLAAGMNNLISTSAKLR